MEDEKRKESSGSDMKVVLKLRSELNSLFVGREQSGGHLEEEINTNRTRKKDFSILRFSLCVHKNNQ